MVVDKVNFNSALECASTADYTKFSTVDMLWAGEPVMYIHAYIQYQSKKTHHSYSTCSTKYSPA